MNEFVESKKYGQIDIERENLTKRLFFTVLNYFRYFYNRFLNKSRTTQVVVDLLSGTFGLHAEVLFGVSFFRQGF